MNAIRWLRICYWWGIIADAVMSILLLFPDLLLRCMGLDLEPDSNIKYGLMSAVPLMAGWTLLLFWASRRPVERKDVLLITAYPVVSGYVILNVYSLATGLASLGRAFPTLLSQVGLLLLSTLSLLSWRQT